MRWKSGVMSLFVINYTVHGIKADNRIENLELWTKGHPIGQRVEDLLLWAAQFIKKYQDIYNIDFETLTVVKKSIQ
jgi:hypothetical protein